jgi:hypothetical protein
LRVTYAIAGISSSGSVTGTCTACAIAASTSVGLQIGTASGFLSERVAGFKLECPPASSESASEMR